MLFIASLVFVIASGSVSLVRSSGINTMLTTRTFVTHKAELKPKLMESITKGIDLAINECQNFFQWERWNCPQSAFSLRVRQSQTREIAFLEAIVAAGIVHVVSNNCSKGTLEECGCGNKHHYVHPNDHQKNFIDWTWEGCLDDVNYAVKIAQNFIESLEPAEDTQAHVRLRNSFVGMKVVQSTVVKRCRCHGISGSCSMKTCWRQLAPFTEIGRVLKGYYEKAIHINMNNKRNAISLEKIKELGANSNTEKLVYLVNSPNYCKKNRKKSWFGTKGRMCSRNQNSADLAEKASCNKLCRSCGYKVKTTVNTFSKNCNCKFNWCCYVTCSSCEETVVEHYCA